MKRIEINYKSSKCIEIVNKKTLNLNSNKHRRFFCGCYGCLKDVPKTFCERYEYLKICEKHYQNKTLR